MPHSRPSERAFTCPACHDHRGAQGFSLVEAIVATVIAVLAALGLAYTFGIGRGNINRFEVARIADAQAQARVEYLGMLSQTRPGSDSLDVGGPYPSPTLPFVFQGARIGSEYWRIDSAGTTVPASIRSSIRRATVEVTWSWAGETDTVRYARLFGI